MLTFGFIATFFRPWPKQLLQRAINGFGADVKPVDGGADGANPGGQSGLPKITAKVLDMRPDNTDEGFSGCQRLGWPLAFKQKLFCRSWPLAD
jgi:hypothetical protein